MLLRALDLSRELGLRAGKLDGGEDRLCVHTIQIADDNLDSQYLPCWTDPQSEW